MYLHVSGERYAALCAGTLRLHSIMRAFPLSWIPPLAGATDMQLHNGNAASDRATHPYASRYGPWALVTGASSGIGLASAEWLAARGLNVVLVARRADILSELAVSLQQRFGVQTLVVAADLRDTEDVQRVLQESDTLDIGLFVAAAGFGTSGKFLDSAIKPELDMLAVNCSAVLQMTHAVAARLRARKRGGIVLFGSVVGFSGVPGTAHYAATKAWVQSFGEGLHHELKPFGVDVIVSAPGPTASGFASTAGMVMGNALTPDVVANGTLRALGSRMTVRPGLLSKLLGYGLSTAPRWAQVRILGSVMRGMVPSLK